MSAAKRAAEAIRIEITRRLGAETVAAAGDLSSLCSIIDCEYAELEKAAEEADAALWMFAAITGREDAGDVYRNLRSALAKVRS